jgi:hypothetical protein
MVTLIRRYAWIGLVVFVVASCGSGVHLSGRHPAISEDVKSRRTPDVVVYVGAKTITRPVYEHWMRIGAATVNIPVPGREPPKPVVYDPPAFVACISNLRASVPAVHGSPGQLRAKCRSTFIAIQARILNFLITADWLEGAAVQGHVLVSGAEVRAEYARERREGYASEASFRRFEAASQQTPADLMLAVRTKLLSAKLLEHFKRRTPARSEASTIAAFNESIKSEWTPQTSCARGYVVPGCKQYPSPKPRTTK